jgi:WhiB family transcriptional regulator, redox-sensing transcriptional regulator
MNGGGIMSNPTYDWRHEAACRDEDPELFFPVSEMGPVARQVSEAKAVCARCPVANACLDYALDNALDFGIFGGTTETERRSLLRRTRRQHQAA